MGAGRVVRGGAEGKGKGRKEKGRGRKNSEGKRGEGKGLEGTPVCIFKFSLNSLWVVISVDLGCSPKKRETPDTKSEPKYPSVYIISFPPFPCFNLYR